MEKEIKEYVKADRKARTYWGKYKTEESPKRGEKLKNKAKDYYAERSARAMKLRNPATKITNTEIKVERSFNKATSNKISAKLGFVFGKKIKNKILYFTYL